MSTITITNIEDLNFQLVLEAYKQKKGLTSDADLARDLGIHRQALSRAKKDGTISELLCFEIAEVIEIPASAVIASREMLKKQSPEQKDRWRKVLAKTFTKSAVGIMLAVLLSLPSPPAVAGSEKVNVFVAGGLYYRKWLSRMLARLLASASTFWNAFASPENFVSTNSLREPLRASLAETKVDSKGGCLRFIGKHLEIGNPTQQGERSLAPSISP